MKKSINKNFFKKKEVIALRKSYLSKIREEIDELETYAKNFFEKKGKLKINSHQYGMVHKMKGVGGTFQFPKITDIAVKILELFSKNAKTKDVLLNEKEYFKFLDLLYELKIAVNEYSKEIEK